MRAADGPCSGDKDKMRRLIVEERTSMAAVFSRRFAVFALAVAFIGVLAARLGLDPPSAYAVFVSAASIACAAILCAIAAFGLIWHSGDRGGGQALVGLGLALLLLAYPAYLAEKAWQLPRLADLSTDIVDPPAFSLSRQALAARGGATPQSIPAAMREAQVRAYPKILPILVDLDGPEAFAAVLKAMGAAGWRIVARTPPGGRLGLGHIDAIAGSFVLNFPYDITARIRPLAGQTRIDIRSVARFDAYDYAANPRNIEKFETALEAEVIRDEK